MHRVFFPSPLQSAALARALSACLLVLLAGLLLAPPQTVSAGEGAWTSAQTAGVMVDASGDRQAPSRDVGDPVKKRKQRHEIEHPPSAVLCEAIAGWLCLARVEPRIGRPLRAASGPVHLRDPGLRIPRGQAPPL